MDLLGNEPALRLAAFGGVLLAMAAWEMLAPRRALSLPRGTRWPANLAIVMLNTAVLRLLLPGAAVGMSVFAQANGWGIFNLHPMPGWAALAAAMVLLDLAIYLQHVLFHAVPGLWRVHRVHHADLDVDVTTGVRFHPVEILLSLLIKFAAIAALGVPPEGVLLFEVVLNVTSMFNHANVRMPATLERGLRAVIVTPDMHRVHHSLERDETHTNFGFNLSLWDRLFGTYRAQPRAGHEGMQLGIPQFRQHTNCVALPGMLALPFRAQERPAGSRVYGALG